MMCRCERLDILPSSDPTVLQSVVSDANVSVRRLVDPIQPRPPILPPLTCLIPRYRSDGKYGPKAFKLALKVRSKWIGDSSKMSYRSSSSCYRFSAPNSSYTRRILLLRCSIVSGMHLTSSSRHLDTLPNAKCSVSRLLQIQ